MVLLQSGIYKVHISTYLPTSAHKHIKPTVELQISCIAQVFNLMALL